MKFKNSVRLILLVCLVALNLILRYPVTPHAIGWDTFTLQILANSVSEFGLARWWVHPLSIGGFYPYSYASAVPYLISGISQCTGISVEWTIWLFCTLTGLFCVFTAYILAGALWTNDLFKFLVAFGYSLSPGLLNFSTWQLSARGPFIILLPLFIYLLFKNRDSLKYLVLTAIIFALLVAIHHLFWFTIPVTFGFIAAILFYKFKNKIKIKIPEFSNSLFIISFTFTFSIPFFTYMFISDTGSRYYWLFLLAETYIRYVGILLIFSIGGFVYLALKNKKSFFEVFIVLTLILLAPLLYMVRYSQWTFIIFAIILACIGLTNVASAPNKRERTAVVIIVVALLLSLVFSTFYQHHRTTEKNLNWYMGDGSYGAALWMKDTIDRDKQHMVGNSVTSNRIFAISEVPTLIGMGVVDLTYGFTSIDDLDISEVSPLSTEFYFEGPYIRTPHTPYTNYYHSLLNEVEVDSYYGVPIMSRFNLSYVIEDEDVGDNPFIRSIHRDKEPIYDNAKIRIWCLE